MERRRTLLVGAAGITSLDEARYFAAMGADWLGFDMSQITIDEFKSITGWVVGPRVFVESDHPGKIVWQELLQEISPDAIVLADEAAVYAGYPGSIVRQVVFHEALQVEQIPSCDVLLVRLTTVPQSDGEGALLRSLCAVHHCWIEADWSGISVQHVFERFTPHGIVIRRNRSAVDEDGYAHYDTFFDAIDTIRKR